MREPSSRETRGGFLHLGVDGGQSQGQRLLRIAAVSEAAITSARNDGPGHHVSLVFLLRLARDFPRALYLASYCFVLTNSTRRRPESDHRMNGSGNHTYHHFAAATVSLHKLWLETGLDTPWKGESLCLP